MKIFFKLDTQVTVITLDDEGNNISALDEIKTYLAGEPLNAWPEYEEDDKRVSFYLNGHSFRSNGDRVIRGVSRNLFTVLSAEEKRDRWNSASLMLT